MGLKVWKDREGNKITAKEFAQRFKEGINNITPIQKLENDMRSTFVSMIGFLISFIALIVFIGDMPNTWLTYGLMLVFLGSIWSNLIKFLSFRVQLIAFKNTDSESIDLKSFFKDIQKIGNSINKEKGDNK